MVQFPCTRFNQGAVKTIPEINNQWPSMESKDDLEIKIAFMDDLLLAVNQTVYQQQNQIEALTKKVENLAKQLEELKQPEARSQESAPPHY